MTTPLDVLIEILRRAADYNPAVEAAPEAVLWCDERREFAPLLPALRARLPQLLTLGAYDPETRTGPAVWLRVAVAGVLEAPVWPESAVPVLYLPGVGRETVRDAQGCPELLRPLVWLGVVGTFFGHVNGKDWTLRSLLAGERGPLRLDVPDDAATRAALLSVAPRLFTTPLDSLRGRRLDADALHAMLAPDLPADMLDWLDGSFDPGADPARFDAFAAQAAKSLGFDPRKLSRHDGAARLASKDGAWATVWSRFEQAAATAYGGVVELLKILQPPDLLADRSAYPRVNAEGEDELRVALAALADRSVEEAGARLAKLGREHAWRRETVWVRRGEAPLAEALRHLATVASAARLPAQEAERLADAYAESGWQVDLAALRALAAAPREVDRAAVVKALGPLYLLWLEEGALALQELARAGNVPLARPGPTPKAETLVFVDGLRMDLGQRLRELLQGEGAEVTLSWRWSGFPTVTATCKPLASPVAERLRGGDVGADFAPQTEDGRPVRKPVLDGLLDAAGWTTTETLLPEGRLWTEAGSFDSEGHALGAKLAERIEQGLRNVADRVVGLARAGRAVRVVTDHGWLLLPDGLPTAKLDAGLLEPQGRRSRCALVKEGAATTYLHLPWTWNAEVQIAVASGARAFIAGQEYAHGGISPQECVLPVLDVQPLAARARLEITRAAWVGLRLRVEVAGGADLRADLRAGASTAGESLLRDIRVLDERGETSMLVSDEHEGAEACLVILDDHGNVMTSRVLKVGVE